MFKLKQYCHIAFILLVLFVQLGASIECNAQAPPTVENSFITSLQATYDKIIFEDSFQPDTLNKMPLNWKGYNRYPGRINENILAVHLYKEDHVLSAYWPWIDILKVYRNGKELDLPDSFIVEFDYLMEKYSVAYDTAKINSFIRRVDTFKTDWPKTDRSSGYGAFAKYVAPIYDTTAIYFQRTYTNARFIADYNKWVWHHAIIEVKQNFVNCYVVGATSFRAFTDTAFKFKHLALGKQERMLYRNIAIKSSGNLKAKGGRFSGLMKNRKMVTRAINFEVNKAIINTSNTEFLNELASWLHDYPEVKLEIDGHTDADGNANANLLLSRQRAEAIKKWLVLTGISADRLTTNGYGSGKPLTTNSTAEGKAFNRRVELVLK